MRASEFLALSFIVFIGLDLAWTKKEQPSNNEDKDSSSSQPKSKEEQLRDIKEKLESAGISDKPSNLLGQNNGPQHPKLKAFNENAHKRPTKCQVCRVLMTELVEELNKTDTKKETVWMSNRLDGEGNEQPTKKIDYSRSEMRITEVLENICHTTKKYKAIAGPEFPYLRGVKSMFRSELEGAMKKSGLALKLDAPEDVLDDPTFEVKRLHAYCNTLIEEHEDDIIDWFLHRREEDPLEAVCREKILKGIDAGCLTASTEVPDYATQPLPDSEPSRIKGEL